MSSVPAIKDAETHVSRALEHSRVGGALDTVGEEWFAVAYFYSAYHFVKASLRGDPVFRSLRDLHTVSPKLTLDVQSATHHSGGFGNNGRSVGVNEAVMLMYKNIRVPYHRLHIASCHVRYGVGLGTISPETVRSDFAAVRTAYEAGEIVATGY